MILFKFFSNDPPSDHANQWCVLTDGIIECLKKDPAFSNQYRIALELMFCHWGIAIEDNDQLEVFDAKRFDTYLMQPNHNQSRASRVIQSLREFSQLDGINTEKLAGNFYLLLTKKAKESLDGDQMTDEQKADLKKSMGFWEKVRVNPLRNDRDNKRCRNDDDDGSHQSKRQRQATTFDISFSRGESIDAVSYPIAIGPCDDEKHYLIRWKHYLMALKRSYPNGHSRENHDGTHAARKLLWLNS